MGRPLVAASVSVLLFSLLPFLFPFQSQPTSSDERESEIVCVCVAWTRQKTAESVGFESATASSASSDRIKCVLVICHYPSQTPPPSNFVQQRYSHPDSVTVELCSGTLAHNEMRNNRNPYEFATYYVATPEGQGTLRVIPVCRMLSIRAHPATARSRSNTGSVLAPAKLLQNLSPRE